MSAPTHSDMKEQLPDAQTSIKSNMEQVGEVFDLADQTLTSEQNKRLLIKTNAVILTIMILASLLAFLDKVRKHICYSWNCLFR